nr:helix-turn-helix domain-containing protein [Paraburkholderia sp. J8-2]
MEPRGKDLPEPVIAVCEPDSGGSSHPTIAREIGEQIGRRARVRRKALRVSRDRMAAHLGVSASTLDKWESGEIPGTLSPEKLAIWEEMLVVPRGWLSAHKPEPGPIADAGASEVRVQSGTFAEAMTMIATVLSVREWDPQWQSLPRGERSQRAIQMLTSRYGLHPDGARTLTELGVAHGITRERARQILDVMIDRIPRYRFIVPALDVLREACHPLLPLPAAVLTEKVRSLLGDHLSIESANRFAVEILGAQIVRISEPETPAVGPAIESIAYAPDAGESFEISDVKLLRSTAYAMIRSCGAAHLATVAGGCALIHGLDASHVRVLESVEGFEWLDADRSWFWFGSSVPARNVLLTVARKMFAVATGRIDISEILTAMVRYRERTATAEYDGERSLMLTPPIHIARAVLERMAWTEVVQFDDFRAHVSFDMEQELSDTELRIVRVLESHGGVAIRRQLRDALPDVKFVTLNFTVGSTPTLRLITRGIYALVGRPLDPVALANAFNALSSVSNRVDVIVTDDGSVTFPFEMTEFAVSSKVCTLPVDAVSKVALGEYRIEGSDAVIDCVKRSSGATVFNRIVQAMTARGFDAGDVVWIVVDPVNRNVRLACESIVSAVAQTNSELARHTTL